MKLVCALALAAALSSPASGEEYAFGDPRGWLINEDALRKAAAEINQMQEPELRSLIHYFSECVDQSEGIGAHSCLAAQTAYRIEFGSFYDKGRTIDGLILAYTGLKAWQTAHRDLMLKDTDKWGKESGAMFQTITALEYTIGERLRALKKGAK